MTLQNNNFLDEFLKHQLLDIGEDDGRFANLQAASEAICDRLKADPWQLSRYTRVGLDKDIDPDEPVFDEIETAIKEHWKLIRNKHTERPVSIIRAVLWESLRGAVEKNSHAAVVALTAKAESVDSNLGPEADACEGFLSQVVTRVERIAEKEWTGRLELAADAEQIKPTPFNAELLAEKLLAACGPNGSDGSVLKEANQHWPSQNQVWSGEFSKRAAKGIYEVVGRHVRSVQTTLNEVVQDLATEIQNARLAISRKTDLLWWSQSQFCISTTTGFSDIPTLVLPFFLATDLQILAPGHCPQSVDHFLAHVVNSAVPKSKKTSVRKMIEVLMKHDFAAAVAKTVEDVPNAAGRCGILAAVKLALSNPTSLDDIEGQLAIGSKEITLAALAQRVFWELKAKSIATSVEPGEANE